MSKIDVLKAREIFESWNPSPEQKLKTYIELFPEQYEAFSKSERADIKGLEENDLFILGNTMERQVMSKQMHEEVSFAQLGATPTLAFDFITAMFGKSVIPYIASEQVIDEMQGLVYFENLVAQGIKHKTVTPDGDKTVEVKDAYIGRGNIDAGDVLARAAGAPDKYPQGFAGEMVYGEQLDETGMVDGTTKEFELALANTPIRRYYVKIIAKCQNSAGAEQTITAVDDGKGALIGAGVVGTIDYDNGAIALTFVNAPVADSHILANYSTNFEVGPLPTIKTELDSKFVKANVYGLQTDVSIISSYAMGKRFKFDMQERAVQVLQESILNEITTELIYKIAVAFAETGETETAFNMTLPNGVSLQSHFNSVDYTFGTVAQKMARRSGKGNLSVALAGPDACAFLEQNAKFEKIGEANNWATVYGVYNKQTIVIRCPQLDQIDSTNGGKTIYFMYKGKAPFDAAAVYAPYMPLVGVEDLPVPDALLNRRSAVASMAAVDCLVPAYIQKFVLMEAARPVQVQEVNG